MIDNQFSFIQIALKDWIEDVNGKKIRNEAKKYLNIETGVVKSTKLFLIKTHLNDEQLDFFAVSGLKDNIINEVYINKLYENTVFKSYIIIARLPGVTDDEGVSAHKTLCDLLNTQYVHSEQKIFTQDLYLFENKLEMESLKKISHEILGNQLINHFEYGYLPVKLSYIPQVDINVNEQTETINVFIPDDELLELSKKMILSLNLEELKAIQNYYKSPQIIQKRQKVGLGQLPTDCEIEIFAQSWSEHCKHKEFNAVIHYEDKEKGEKKTIDSLFNTYIKKSTEVIRNNLESWKNNWLVKVFSDNAGIVRVDENRLLVWKVETHNTPSALDPYGGSITGIVGVNRDPLGTGTGGARLLFNTDVLCFAPPSYSGKLLSGQLHPRRIFTGVIHGIEDGGNKSGIPTVNGAVIFDERYRGKPLVFCGTGGIMPAYYNGKKSWEKDITAGDLIVMAGGRVGKDGIHGATFSSTEINEHSPRSAVQIGSPITQKLLSQFQEEATLKGLIKCSTDNGAGGLSSSIGELAQIPGGAVVNLEKVPLKYSGLKPWEIFISESQERMTFVIEKDKIDQLFELADIREVELSNIGYFTSDGILDVRYNNKTIAYLDLDFLHRGVPRKTLEAQWIKPELTEPVLPEIKNYNEVLLKLLSSLNICSRESIIRQYDHEVKGRSVIKPLMGPDGNSPQDSAVIRLDFDSYKGIAVSNGIMPKFGDIDPYQMSAGAFDEAVRQIISVGGKLPVYDSPKDQFWSVNDNFCIPDSAFDSRTNPDGKYKLAKLVQMCEALYDMSTYFNIPMTSGKDSMKNDFISDGQKISVPHTILYSIAAKIDDIRKTVTSEFKSSGDLIYILGKTYDELGGSEFYKLFNETGANVPLVRKEYAKQLYLKIMKANEKSLIESSHDLSDGGFVVGVAECIIGGKFGAQIELNQSDLSLNSVLFSESHSRFIVSVKKDNQELFESVFGSDCELIGVVTSLKRLIIKYDNEIIIDADHESMLDAWKDGLRSFL